MPAAVLRAQLLSLRRAGYHFIWPDELGRFIAGEAGFPRNALLLTFDDCYRSVAEDGRRVVSELGVQAIAFVVTERIGQHNDWDVRHLGVRPVPLADASDLSALASAGIELGSHSRTHAVLTRLSDAELASENAGYLAAFTVTPGVVRRQEARSPYPGSRSFLRTWDCGFG